MARRAPTTWKKFKFLLRTGFVNLLIIYVKTKPSYCQIRALAVRRQSWHMYLHIYIHKSKDRLCVCVARTSHSPTKLTYICLANKWVQCQAWSCFDKECKSFCSKSKPLKHYCCNGPSVHRKKVGALKDGCFLIDWLQKAKSEIWISLEMVILSLVFSEGVGCNHLYIIKADWPVVDMWCL